MAARFIFTCTLLLLAYLLPTQNAALSFFFQITLLGTFAAYFLHTAQGAGQPEERKIYYGFFALLFAAGLAGMGYIYTQGSAPPPTLTRARAEPLYAPDFSAPVGMRVTLTLSHDASYLYAPIIDTLRVTHFENGNPQFLRPIPDGRYTPPKVNPTLRDVFETWPQKQKEQSPTTLIYNFYTPEQATFRQRKNCVKTPLNDQPRGSKEPIWIPLKEGPKAHLKWAWHNRVSGKRTHPQTGAPADKQAFLDGSPVTLEMPRDITEQIAFADDMLLPQNMRALGFSECPQPKNVHLMFNAKRERVVCYCKQEAVSAPTAPNDKDTPHAPE